MSTTPRLKPGAGVIRRRAKHSRNPWGHALSKGTDLPVTVSEQSANPPYTSLARCVGLAGRCQAAYRGVVLQPQAPGFGREVLTQRTTKAPAFERRRVC